MINKKTLKSKKGFTIVELVIVIAVIAILAAVLIPTFTNVSAKAKESAALQVSRNAYTEFIAETVAENDLSDKTVVIESDGYYFNANNGELERITTYSGATLYGYTVTGYSSVTVYVNVAEANMTLATGSIVSAKTTGDPATQVTLTIS